MEGRLWKHILLKEDVFFYLVLIQLDDPYYSYVDLCIDHLNLPSRQQRNVVQGYELDLVGKYFVQKVGPTIYSFIFLLP